MINFMTVKSKENIMLSFFKKLQLPVATSLRNAHMLHAMSSRMTGKFRHGITFSTEAGSIEANKLAIVIKASFKHEKIMSPEDVEALMRSSKSNEEWSRNCRMVTTKFKGDFPPFWFETIIVPGVLNETQRTWSKPSSTSVTPSFIRTSHVEELKENEIVHDSENSTPFKSRP